MIEATLTLFTVIAFFAWLCATPWAMSKVEWRIPSTRNPKSKLASFLMLSWVLGAFALVEFVLLPVGGAIVGKPPASLFTLIED